MGISVGKAQLRPVSATAARPGRSRAINAFLTVARSADLPKSIAESIKMGRRVVLLDVNFDAPFARGSDITIRDAVIKEGIAPSLLEGPGSRLINLDHHNPALGAKTSTELVFDRLDELRSIDEPVEVLVNHGDTDSLTSLYVLRNMDRTFSRAESDLLIRAARAGDHGVQLDADGKEAPVDYKLPIERFSDPLRLDLAITAICLEHKLPLWKIWDAKSASDELIASGVSKVFRLIDDALVSATVLHLPATEALIEKIPLRMSIKAIDERQPGVTLDYSIPGYPIATVDVTTPGFEEFDTLAAFSSLTNPAIIIIVRNGRMVGVGRNNSYADWLKLDTDGFYDLTGRRLQGRDAAGGLPPVAREAFDALPSPEEGLALAKQFLMTALKKKRGA